MITGDNKLTAEVIAKEANVNEVMAEAKPTDKLTRGSTRTTKRTRNRYGWRWNK
jgi:high-affinity K+ transport system ATPase subunit B